MINIANYLKPQCGGKMHYNFLFATLLTIAVFLPDLVLKALYDLPIGFEGAFLGGIFFFCFLLSLAGTITVSILITLFVLMQIIQLNYMAYFGTPIEATSLMNITREARDIFNLSYLRYTWFNAPLLILLYGASLYVFKKYKMIKIKWIWLIIVCASIHKPYRAFSHSKDIWYFQPSITCPSLRNSISTFSYFFFRYLPDGSRPLSINYKPYSAKQDLISETENVLLIWGESLYGPHLQIYGYNRETFPKMGKRIKENADWTTAMGISSGIATATSTMLFFNGVREPANMNEIKRKTSNLFHLAKQAGFNTYYFSVQESRLTMSLSSEDIDKIITNDTRPLFFKRFHDEGLGILLNKLDLNKGKNFIVLHMRSPHSPFELRYKGREDEFEKFKPAGDSKDRFTYYKNTYDNALLYTDAVIDMLVSKFEKLSANKKYSIFITGDHGELMNYEGMYGHNNLVLEQAKVPFFMKQKNHKKLPPVLSYYQINRIIAQEFGFNIINPNEEDHTYYLHSNNIDYPYDYIKYQINKDGKIKQIEKNNTSNLQQ